MLHYSKYAVFNTCLCVRSDTDRCKNVYDISTPVYAAPDLNSTIVVYLERFVNVTVTGITDNGFYRVISMEIIIYRDRI